MSAAKTAPVNAPTWSWVSGARVDTNPAVAGPFLTGFLSRNGTAAGLLDEARTKRRGHWLREELLVDVSDAVLADEHRLSRARLVLRSIEVQTSPDVEPQRLTVSVFTSVQNDDDDDAKLARRYSDRESAKRNRFLRRQMVEKGEQKLREWLHAYGDLSELDAVIVAIRTYFN